MPNKDYHHLRENYDRELLHRDQLDPNPIIQLNSWLEEAKASGLSDANAMCLCTQNSSGVLRQRQVLLKEIFENKIIFYTNYTSQKAVDIKQNPNVSLNFFFRDQFRQISVSGIARKVSREHSENYFKKRPRNSQIAAWASRQSSILKSRDELTACFKSIEQQFEGQDIPLPDFWGGFAVKPDRFEFWQGVQDRMHDRFEYLLDDEKWMIQRLSP